MSESNFNFYDLIIFVFSFTGECEKPGQMIRSCQVPGTQFLIANQKFTINYTKCEEQAESLSGGNFTFSVFLS